VTPHEERLRDAYLAEMWPTVREVPAHERKAKRKADAVEQWVLGRMAAETEARDVPVLPGTEVA
jgi:hypothetical protein